MTFCSSGRDRLSGVSPTPLPPLPRSSMLPSDGRRNDSFGPCGSALHRTDPLLGRNLNTYDRMVMAGEWRDYAIDFRDEAAVFSVFRSAAEIPLYSIEKRPKLKDRQGQYSVVAAGGQVLGRGHDLTSVLRVLERKLLRAVAAE